GFGPYSYNWSPGTGSSIAVSPTVTTAYSVIVTNVYGCTSTANQTVTVIDIRDGNKNKVFICHYGHSLSVSVNAVPDHLSHGDQLGDCVGSITRVNQQIEEQSSTLYLYPNPANDAVTLPLKADADEHVVIKVSDLQGKIVMQPLERNLKAGIENIILNV